MQLKPSIPLKVFGIVIGALLVLPTLVVVPMSFSPGDILSFPPKGFSLRWYHFVFTESTWTTAIIQSLKIAILTTILSLALGIATALAMVRGRLRLTGPLQILVLSPMIMPLVVLAVGMFFVFSDWRLLGSVGGLVLAHTVLAYPLVYLSVSTSLQGSDESLELASASLGGGRLYTLRRVTLPLIAPGVLTGALFAFTMSWDELILSIFLSGPTVKTLPVRMWEQIQTELTPALAAAATLVMALTITLILVAAWIASTRRKALKS
ncbi:MAG: ABC transporter permease [Hyphomicrobiales bacterium]|jgi:putative spermidine/putrescine transport system permease protein|nr:MAG: ABC transporter permease [Hyphomicrobiales bacterium]